MSFYLSIAVAVQDSQTSLLNTVMQQEMAQRRQRIGVSRQDSRLSVKSLIESIEKSSHVAITLYNSNFYVKETVIMQFLTFIG